MEPNKQEREIDLVQLILAVWKKVNIIIIAGVIGAVLVGAFRILPALRNVNSDEVKNQLERDYQSASTAYNNQSNQLNIEIGNLEEEVNRQTEYVDNSILMQMNPFDVHVATTQYYVDAGFQIMPELVYQNRDMTNTILSAYYNIAQRGEMFQYICDNISTGLEMRYLSEILTVEADYSLGTLTLQVNQVNEEDCTEVMDLAKEYLTKKTYAIKSAIGEHKFVTVNSAQITTVNLSYLDTQKINNDNLKLLEDNLAAKQSELKNLASPQKGVPASALSVVKGGFKWIIIGGFLGVFLAGAFYLVKFMTDTTIKTEKDVAFFLDLPVLGNIPMAAGTMKTVLKEKRGKKKRLNQYGMSEAKQA